MESLWTKVDRKLAIDLLNKAAHVDKVEDKELYLVTPTSVQDMIIDFLETELETYEFKNRSR